MTYEKFKLTLQTNKGIEESVELDLEAFREKYDFGENITSVIFDIIQKEAITLLLPLIDEGIGAIHFHIDDDDIVIINTNQPMCMMFFSAIHDFHHILFHEKHDHHDEFEIHLNSETYNRDTKERQASLFAANLLMPKYQLLRAFRTFSSYITDLDEILVRLMIKFEAPLEAVLLRLYEVEILRNTDDIKHLLELSSGDIIDLIKKYNKSPNIMRPYMIKDISPLLTYKAQIQKRETLSENDLNLLMKDLEKYIDKISLGE